MRADEISHNHSTPRGGLFVFLFFFGLYALSMPGVSSGGDAYLMYLAAESLVKDGDPFLAHQPDLALVPGINERPVSKFDIGQSLVETPFYRLGDYMEKKASPRHGMFVKYLVVSFTAPVVSAAAITLLYLLCGGLGYGQAASLAMAFLVGMCSLFWPHARLLFSEPLQTLSLVGAVFSLNNFRRGGGFLAALSGGFFVGMACASKSALILTLPIFATYFAGGLREYKMSRRVISAASFLAPLAMWAVVMLGYNYMRYGDMFATGYMRPDNREGVYKFSVSLLTGAHGLLFSSGKGLLFYCPLVVFAALAYPGFYRRRRAEAVLVAAVFAAVLVPFSKWGMWHGDYTWGPRFLVPTVPLLLLPIGDMLTARKMPWGRIGAGAFVATAALSLLIQVMGVFVNYNEYIGMIRFRVPFDISFEGTDPARLDLRDNMLSLHYVPEFSPLAGHWWILKHIAMDRGLDKKTINERMKVDFPWKSLAPYAVPPEPSRAVMVDCWWYYLSKYFPRSSGWVKWLAGALGAMCAISCAALAWLATRRIAQ